MTPQTSLSSHATQIRRRQFLGVLGGLAASCMLPSESSANLTTLPPPLPLSTAMRESGFRAAPVAWLKLIEQHPDLDPAAHPFSPMTLTPEHEAQLWQVHQQVNRLIRFRPDGPDRWQLVHS